MFNVTQYYFKMSSISSSLSRSRAYFTSYMKYLYYILPRFPDIMKPIISTLKRNYLAAEMWKVLISTICNEVSGWRPSQLDLCTNLLLLDIKFCNMAKANKATNQTFHLPLLHCTCSSMSGPQTSYFSGFNLFLLHPGFITGAISPSKVLTHTHEQRGTRTGGKTQGSHSPWLRVTPVLWVSWGGHHCLWGWDTCRMQGTSILTLQQDLGDFQVRNKRRGKGKDRSGLDVKKYRNTEG